MAEDREPVTDVKRIDPSILLARLMAEAEAQVLNGEARPARDFLEQFKQARSERRFLSNR